jgi:hypothetical protein
MVYVVPVFAVRRDPDGRWLVYAPTVTELSGRCGVWSM